MRIFGFIAVCLGVLSPLFVLANVSQIHQFCGLQKVTQELQSSKLRLSDERRLSQMEELFTQIKLLDTHQKSIPKGFVRNCYLKKEETFRNHRAHISSAALGNSRFLKVWAEYKDFHKKEAEALEYYDRLVKIQPDNFQAAFRALVLWNKLKVKNLLGHKESLDSDKVKQVVQETIDRSFRIARNSKFPSEIRLRALLGIRSLYQTVPYLKKDSQKYWELIHTLDPKNLLALRQLLIIAKAKNDTATAKRYADQLLQIEGYSHKKLLQALQHSYKLQDMASIDHYSAEGMRRYPKVSWYPAYRAYFLVDAGRRSEAYEALNKALELNRKNKVARNLASQISEEDADQMYEQGEFTKALTLYNQALEYSLGNNRLRRKMANLIYSYHRDQNFVPPESSHKDLNFAIKLMTPVIQAKVVAESDLTLAIQVAAHSGKARQAAPWCRHFEADYKIFGSLELLIDCVNIYKDAKNINKARELLESGIRDKRFQGQKDKLREKMRKL